MRSGPAIPGRSHVYVPHSEMITLPSKPIPGAAHRQPVDISEHLKLSARLTATDAHRKSGIDPQEVLLLLGLDNESLGPKIARLAEREEARRNEVRKKARDLSQASHKA